MQGVAMMTGKLCAHASMLQVDSAVHIIKDSAPCLIPVAMYLSHALPCR